MANNNKQTKVTKKLVINGKEISIRMFPTDRLLDALRNNGHTITKEGCGEGICGACSIILNDKLINSCLTLFGQMHEGDEIKTAEIDDNRMKTIKEAFANSGAVQCGFCTPGMLLATYTLLTNNKTPTDEDIKKALSGNLCRCTGYARIIEAVKIAMEKL